MPPQQPKLNLWAATEEQQPAVAPPQTAKIPGLGAVPLTPPRKVTPREQLPLLMRLAPPVIAGVATGGMGTIPAMAATGGAGFLGELGAQQIEGSPTSLGRAGLAGLLTGFPFARPFRGVGGFKGTALRTGATAAQGGMLGAGAEASGALLNEGRLPSWGEVGHGAALGGAFGGGMHGLLELVGPRLHLPGMPPRPTNIAEQRAAAAQEALNEQQVASSLRVLKPPDPNNPFAPTATTTAGRFTEFGVTEPGHMRVAVPPIRNEQALDTWRAGGAVPRPGLEPPPEDIAGSFEIPKPPPAPGSAPAGAVAPVPSPLTPEQQAFLAQARTQLQADPQGATEGLLQSPLIRGILQAPDDPFGLALTQVIMEAHQPPGMTFRQPGAPQVPTKEARRIGMVTRTAPSVPRRRAAQKTPTDTQAAALAAAGGNDTQATLELAYKSALQSGDAAAAARLLGIMGKHAGVPPPVPGVPPAAPGVPPAPAAPPKAPRGPTRRPTPPAAPPAASQLDEFGFPRPPGAPPAAPAPAAAKPPTLPAAKVAPTSSVGKGAQAWSRHTYASRAEAEAAAVKANQAIPGASAQARYDMKRKVWGVQANSRAVAAFRAKRTQTAPSSQPQGSRPPTTFTTQGTRAVAPAHPAAGTPGWQSARRFIGGMTEQEAKNLHQSLRAAGIDVTIHGSKARPGRWAISVWKDQALPDSVPAPKGAGILKKPPVPLVVPEGATEITPPALPPPETVPSPPSKVTKVAPGAAAGAVDSTAEIRTQGRPRRNQPPSEATVAEIEARNAAAPPMPPRFTPGKKTRQANRILAGKPPHEKVDLDDFRTEEREGPPPTYEEGTLLTEKPGGPPKPLPSAPVGAAASVAKTPAQRLKALPDSQLRELRARLAFAPTSETRRGALQMVEQEMVRRSGGGKLPPPERHAGKKLPPPPTEKPAAQIPEPPPPEEGSLAAQAQALAKAWGVEKPLRSRDYTPRKGGGPPAAPPFKEGAPAKEPAPPRPPVGERLKGEEGALRIGPFKKLPPKPEDRSSRLMTKVGAARAAALEPSPFTKSRGTRFIENVQDEDVVVKQYADSSEARGVDLGEENYFKRLRSAKGGGYGATQADKIELDRVYAQAKDAKLLDDFEDFRDLRGWSRLERTFRNEGDRARWARLWRGKGLPLGITPDKAESALRTLESKLTPEQKAKFESWTHELDRLHGKKVDAFEEAGWISHDEASKWRARGGGFLHMERMRRQVSASAMSRIRALRNAGAMNLDVAEAMERFEGATTLTRRPYDADLSYLQQANRELQRNDVARLTVKGLQKDPLFKGYVTRLTHPSEVPPPHTVEIHFYDKAEPGVRQRWAIPAELGLPLLNMSATDLRIAGVLPSVLGRAKAGLVRGATTYSVGFFVANPARDVSTARKALSVFKLGNPADALKSYTTEFVQNFRDVLRQHPDYLQALREGSLYGTLTKSAFGETFITNPAKPSIAGSLGRGIMKYASAGEEATKLMSWRRLRDAGIGGVDRPFKVRTMGGSPDFAVGGKYRPLADTLFMFLNPGIQGIAQSVSFVRRSPKRLAMVASVAALSSLARAKWNSQFKEEDGSNTLDHVDRRVRDTNFIFVIPSKEDVKHFLANLGIRNKAALKGLRVETMEGDRASYLAIPKGHLSQLLFNPIEQAIDMAIGGTTTFTQAAENTASNLLPSSGRIQFDNLLESTVNSALAAANPIIGTTVDLARNVKSYQGTPLEPLRMANYAPGERYTPFTSPSAVELAKKFGVGPAALEYAMRRVSPGPADVILSSADVAAAKLQGRRQIDTTSIGRMRRIPLAGTLLKRVLGPGTTDQLLVEQRDRFYNALEKARTASGTTEVKKRRFDPTLKKWVIETAYDKMLGGPLGDIERSLSDIMRKRETLAFAIMNKEKFSDEKADLFRKALGALAKLERAQLMKSDLYLGYRHGKPMPPPPERAP
jgi:hypothetical protein